MFSFNPHFGYLNFCSNIIEGYKHLIHVNGKYEPLVIEKGTPPLITLKALLPNNEVMTVLERNVPRAREVSVAVDGARITVFALDIKVISAIATEADKCEVDFMNFEPLGLLIQGDQKSLRVAGMEMSRGRYSNTGTVLKIGP